MDENKDVVVSNIDKRMAPWAKELVVQSLVYESGMQLARLRIREGRRFTIIDLDADTISWLEDAFRRALAPSQPTAD